MYRVADDEVAPITVVLNGQSETGQATSRTLLSDFLRQVLGATGTHVGCEHGVCGCCTVLIDGIAVRSCLTLAVQVDDQSIETVEGLAKNQTELNELQKAFSKHHALQCGYCTPGILMSFTDYLRRNPHPDETSVRDVLSGHICRCTGYDAIVTAVLDAAAELRNKMSDTPTS
ncbi:MAG: (2Fe-2S)-binding protein [Hyphomicrobiaceae bacterium]